MDGEKEQKQKNSRRGDDGLLWFRYAREKEKVAKSQSTPP
jgi:hypothetical protein